MDGLSQLTTTAAGVEEGRENEERMECRYRHQMGEPREGETRGWDWTVLGLSPVNSLLASSEPRFAHL